MKVQGLDHFGIEVNDLKQAEHFYGEVLGLQAVTRFGDQVILDCGGQNLALFQVRREPLTAEERRRRIGHPLGQAHHAFRVGKEDFSQAATRLREAGVESAPQIDWGDHDCLYFLDPDGNLLELISYRVA